MKIVVRTPNFIGDSVMMLSAFELLKQAYPNAKFTVVTKASSIDLFRGKGVERFIVDDTKSSKKGRWRRIIKLIAHIRKEHYDLGFLFHNSFLNALVFKLSRIDTIIGYNKESRKVLLDFWLKIDRSRHYINHYAYLVNAYIGHTYHKLPLPQLSTEPSQLLDKKTKPLVGFVLGGANKGNRHYPKALALELFELLKEKPIDIVLLGDGEDSEHNRIYESHLKEHSNCDIINLSGQTTVAEFIDAIASLDLLVTIDTSAMHIAAATHTPFITLVGKGSSSFDVVKPKVDWGSYLYKDCLDIDDSNLIANIKPDIIRDSIQRYLDGNK